MPLTLICFETPPLPPHFLPLLTGSTGERTHEQPGGVGQDGLHTLLQHLLKILALHDVSRGHH